jgi:hypothetical protein
MVQGTGDSWYFNATYDILGEYSYTVYANDTHGWNGTGPGTFRIIDTDGPFLDNLMDSPDPQGAGGSVTFTVDVTDDVQVDTVWINISYQGVSITNESMFLGTGDEFYFTELFDELGVYSYIVYANDTSDNWGSAGPGIFTIIDNTPPEFDNLVETPDPQDIGENVNITVEITDDTGIDEVWIHITFPDDSSINVSMTQGEGDTWYYDATYNDLGDFTYIVWANDTHNNWNHSETGSFLIVDRIPPEIEPFEKNPDPQEILTYVSIVTNVTDNVEVEEVWLNITHPEVSGNSTMYHFYEDTWYQLVMFTDVGEYSVTIWAKDTSGNWNSLSEGTILIQDTSKPELGDPVVNPDPAEEGDDVNISVTAWDEYEIDEVYIIITFPDGTTVNSSMEKGPGYLWFLNDSFNESGEYSYTIYAVDNNGNTNSTAPESFNINPPEEPEDEDKFWLKLILLFFWPFLLIIFTLALIRRCEPSRRFRRDIDPVLNTLPSYYQKAGSTAGSADLRTVEGIVALSLNMGIPVEEFLLARILAKSEALLVAEFSYEEFNDLNVLIRYI